MKSKFKNFFKFIINIYDPNLSYYASSLSFYTISSLMPLLLVSLSIFTQMPSFKEYYLKIKEFIFSSLLPNNQDIIAFYIDEFLKNSLGLSIIGFMVMIFTSFMFFSSYDRIINKILQTKRRGFWLTLSSYWTLISLSPIVLALGFYLANFFQKLLGGKGFYWIQVSSFFYFIAIWIIFCVLYLVSSNGNLRVRSSVLASFFSSLTWYFGKNLFVHYATKNHSYLNIYGSFSIMIFFFLWVYISWIVFLYGLKIAKFLSYLNKKADDSGNGQ